MWQEQMRGGSQPRIRIVELLDYIPKESVHTQSTPDNIPYAKSEPDEADGQYEFLKSGKIAGKVSGYIDYCSSRSLPEKGIISQSQSLYVNYSDEDNAVYNGYEKTEVLKEGNVIYEADLKLTGIKSGEMKMRLHFAAGKYENPPKLSFEKDENGKPMSYGYAEYDSWRLNVKDMSE